MVTRRILNPLLLALAIGAVGCASHGEGDDTSDDAIVGVDESAQAAATTLQGILQAAVKTDDGTLGGAPPITIDAAPDGTIATPSDDALPAEAAPATNASTSTSTLDALDCVGPELTVVKGAHRTFHVYPVGSGTPKAQVSSSIERVLVTYDDGVFLYSVDGGTAWLDRPSANDAAEELATAWQGPLLTTQSLHLQGFGTELVSDVAKKAVQAWMDHAVPAFRAVVQSAGERLRVTTPRPPAPTAPQAPGDVGDTLRSMLSQSGGAELNAISTRLRSDARELGLVGFSNLERIGKDFAASQSPEYWGRVIDDLAKLADKPDLTERQRLIREIMGRLNVPSIASKEGRTVQQGIGGGNCGNAALVGLLSLGLGSLVCTMAYPPNSANSVHNFVETFTAAGVKTESTGYFTAGEDMARVLEQKLGEGQMAWMYSGSTKGAHATIVVKMGGKLYNINNQGWEEALRLPPGQLQELGAWMQSWKSLFQVPDGYAYSYMAVVTDLKIVGF